MSDDNSRYLVDHIFPERTIHLFSGPIGSGISTLLAQTLRDWSLGLPVFGQPSHPVPFCYVCCERPAFVTHRLMDRLGMARASYPLISLHSHRFKPDERTWGSVLNLASRKVPGLRALWIDGFTSLCTEEITKARDVRKFLGPIDEECDQRGITVFGSGQAVKIRGDGYQSSHDRVMGSGLLASITSTKIYLEYAKPHDITDPHRWVTIAPQNIPSRKQFYSIESAGFTLATEVKEQNTNANIFVTWLLAQPLESIFTRADLIRAGDALGISTRSMDRLLENDCAACIGVIHCGDKYGTYEFTNPS